MPSFNKNMSAYNNINKQSLMFTEQFKITQPIRKQCSEDRTHCHGYQKSKIKKISQNINILLHNN